MYRKQFKKYLIDLALRKPAPGGGSVAALIFCLGISLMEKALAYSLKSGQTLTVYQKKFNQLNSKVFPYIDLDGKFFALAMAKKDTARIAWLKKSENLVNDLASNCVKVFALGVSARLKIKPGLKSDFDSGFRLIRSALEISVQNLDANAFLFKKRFAGRQEYNRILKLWAKF